MNNKQKALELFYKQYPQYEKDKAYLDVNLYCDILDTRKPEKDRIIAISDLPHDLMEIGTAMPKKWLLKA